MDKMNKKKNYLQKIAFKHVIQVFSLTVYEGLFYNLIMQGKET